MTTVGLYARVSTKDKNQNPQSQFAIMEEYCIDRGWRSIRYSDKESGKLERAASRGDLDRLMQDIKTNKLDGAVILNEERFARSIELGSMLIRVIRESNKFLDIVERNLHITKENWSPNMVWQTGIGFIQGEAGNLQHGIDVKRGIAEAKRKALDGGKTWVWARGIGSVQINENEVIDLNKRGYSIRRIARKLGVSKTKIHNVLKRGMYAGISKK